MNGKNSLVVVKIREMILQGHLLPGQRIREAELAKSLGVSRTPVREALPMLAQEGILRPLDTRGFVVREFSAEEIMDAIDVRGVLEGLAARILTEQGIPRRLMQSLMDCLRDGDAIFAKRRLVESDEERYGEMNKVFHGLIIKGAGSKVIADAIERNDHIPFAAAHVIAFEKVDLQHMYTALWYSHQQHHGIVEALARGEGERVAALMFEHAYRSKANINLKRHARRLNPDETKLDPSRRESEEPV